MDMDLGRKLASNPDSDHDLGLDQGLDWGWDFDWDIEPRVNLRAQTDFPYSLGPLTGMGTEFGIRPGFRL